MGSWLDRRDGGGHGSTPVEIRADARCQLLEPAAVLADPLPQWPDRQRIDRPGDRGDSARILFTTGSTGTPKAVLLGGKQLARVATANISVRGLRSDDRYAAMLPAFHAAGSLFEDSLPAIGGKYSATAAFARFVPVPRRHTDIDVALAAPAVG